MLNYFKDDTPKRIFIAIAIAFAAIHFSLPLVLTYDSGHYYHYLKIFLGQLPLAEWDRVRQPGYPLFLFFVQIFFGGSQQSFLLFHFVLLLTVVNLGLKFVWKNYSSHISRIFFLIYLVVFVLLEPLVVGYYHVLLTEAFAAGLCAISCFRACDWYRYVSSAMPSTRETWQKVGFWLFLVVFSYHLKQSYVFCALVPFFVSSAFGLYSNRSAKIALRVVLRSFSFVVSVLILSVVLWSWVLPTPESKAMHDRLPASWGTKLLIGGVARATNVGSFDIHLKDSGHLYLPSSIRDKVQSIAKTGLYNTQCSAVYKLGSSAEDAYSFLLCKELQPTFSDALKFCLTSFFQSPIQLLLGYGEGLLRLVRALPSGVSVGGGQYVLSLENEAIGFKPFRGEWNVDPMPSQFATGLDSFRQLDVVRARGFFGLLPYKLFLGQTVFFFSFLLIFLLIVFPVLILLLATKSLTQVTSSPMFLFLLAASATAIVHSVFHVVLGMVIDRYAFPVFFTGIFAFGFLVTEIVDKSLKKL
jgi:hypothetical protein